MGYGLEVCFTIAVDEKAQINGMKESSKIADMQYYYAIAVRKITEGIAKSLVTQSFRPKLPSSDIFGL